MKMATMSPWQQRPPEIAYLLNPAFCGAILRRCIQRYQKESPTNATFPYPVVFLVLPIVLHQKTRASIPKHSKEQLHIWLQTNPHIRIGLAERAKQLVPITKESLSFLLQAGALKIDTETGGLRLVPRYRQPSRDKSREDEEIDDCYKKAETLGRWFARAGSPTTVFTILGVAP